ncbi:hypothetical protein pb186bvf_012064 [Paramecium bursaria]
MNYKPFSFQLPQAETFNPVLLENVDQDLADAGDMSTCAPFLRNFVQSHITADTIREMSFLQFKKMLHICQNTIDFYTQLQEQKEQQINERNQILQSKQEQLDKLKLIDKQHQQKQQQISKELDQLKEEAKKVKEAQIKSILFKCHHCDKLFQGKEYLVKHIETKHAKQPSDEVTNPEYLASMLQQIQVQNQQSMANTGQSWARPFANTQPFGNTVQSMGMADPMMLGTAGFQQLKQQQLDKLSEKQSRKEERKLKREQDRQERIERIRLQESQMGQFQSTVQTILDSKMSDMIKVQTKITNQQQFQLQQQKKLMADLEEIKNQKVYIKEQSVIQEQQPVNQTKNDDSLNDMLKDKQQLGDSDDNLDSLQMNKDQRLLITKNQQIADQSGMISFHNYSYNDKSLMQIKQPDDDKLQNIGNQKINSEMAHIGELESDNEQLEGDQDADYLRPQNKRSQVESAQIEYLQELRKKQTNFEEKVIDDDIVNQLDWKEEVKKNRIKQFGEDVMNKDQKELQSLNLKAQEFNK